MGEILRILAGPGEAAFEPEPRRGWGGPWQRPGGRTGSLLGSTAYLNIVLEFCKSPATTVKIGEIDPFRPQIALAHLGHRSI